MDDDPGAAEDERIIELSSIAAIFPELVLDPKSPYDAVLNIDVSPTKPLKIRFQQPAKSGLPVLPTPPTSIEADDDGNLTVRSKPKALGLPRDSSDVHLLDHLPPITLNIHLPEGYPATKAPVIDLSCSPAWIPNTKLRSLQEDGLRLWEELGKDQVVYTYIDHLRQAAEGGFNLAGKLQENVTLSGDMKLSLLDFDLKTKRDLFEKETFDCGVCLEPKKGINCHRLFLCSHVFCAACLQDFYNNCIAEGDVDNVKCLTPDCGKPEQPPSGPLRKRRKLDRTLNPSELLQIPIEQEVVQRYVRLKRKKRLESDKTTIYCPRQWCQGAARSKKHPKPLDPLNEEEEILSDSEDANEDEITTRQKTKKGKSEEIPMSERLCICEDCNFAFCSVCKKGWHGELAVCNPRRQQELNEEEKASLQYLEMHTTACPTCSAPSQKTMGCNHMICYKCKAHFCYLCSSYLMPDNPYRHFNDLKSQCYMRLWELEGGDGDRDEVGIGYAGGINWDQDDSDDDGSSISTESEDDGAFDNFGGDGDFIHFSDEEDSDDDEPAPDQRPAQAREFRIEIVNFARAGGVANQHIIQNIPRAPQVPPAAPAPPRRNGQLGRIQPLLVHQGRPWVGPQQRAGRVNLPRAHGHQRMVGDAVRARPQLEPQNQGDEDTSEEDDDNEEREMVRAAPAPGQGNAAAQQPAPVRAMGLERFLELAQRDQEDEWDSDELEE